MLSLTKCRTCKKVIPPRSKECPHCHTKYPVARIENLVTMLIVVVLIGWSGIGSMIEESNATAAAEEQAKLEADAACRADLNCWAKKHVLYAIDTCTQQIVRDAPHGYEFTTSLGNPLFVRWDWAGQEDGYLAYYGDELKWEDQYGEWWRLNYACEYNPATDNALNVIYEPGPLK